MVCVFVTCVLTATSLVMSTQAATATAAAAAAVVAIDIRGGDVKDFL